MENFNKALSQSPTLKEVRPIMPCLIRMRRVGLAQQSFSSKIAFFSSRSMSLIVDSDHTPVLFLSRTNFGSMMVISYRDLVSATYIYAWRASGIIKLELVQFSSGNASVTLTLLSRMSGLL